MGVQRVETLSADAGQAYVAARELINQIVGVLSARTADATGDTAAALREPQGRYSSDLQRLGLPGGVSVAYVLEDYPAILARLRNR